MNAEIISSGFAMLIALCALWLTIYEGRATRRHNRLSVMPCCSIGLDVDVAKQTIFYNIENEGLGPAKINSIEFKIDGKVEPHNRLDFGEYFFEKLGLRGGAGMNHFGDGDFLQPSKSISLLRFDNPLEPFSKQSVWNLFRQVTIEVRYESIYGDKEEVCQWLLAS